jgi:tetratricopeptide (TPR) repeat protein
MARGRFYLNRGMIRRRTGTFEEALSDYINAVDCFRGARSVRYEAAAQNNIAGIYLDLGRFAEAHAAARSALASFSLLEDHAHEAKVWDQIAQIYGREGCFDDMHRATEKAVRLLSGSDHESWLAEALTTHGIACARLGMSRAQEHLRRALEICDRQGDMRQADLTVAAMWETVRLGKCLLETLKCTVSPVERMVCDRVLRKHAGRLRPAARELGLTHQALQRKLQFHFPDLLKKHRSAKKVR